jgi:hypothetical protein
MSATTSQTEFVISEFETEVTNEDREAIINATSDAVSRLRDQISDDTLQSNPDYAPLTEEMKATGRYKLSISEREIPHFIGIFDRTIQIGVDEDGEPRAMLETDSEQVVEWAKGKHESYKEQSETVF